MQTRNTCMHAHTRTLICATIALVAAGCDPAPDDIGLDATDDRAGTEPLVDEAPALDVPQPVPPDVPEARIVDSGSAADGASAAMVAVADLQPTGGSSAAGTARFTLEDDGALAVQAHMTGLPAGTHGLHIHEFGDCSGAAASAAGDHFAPDGSPHGSPYAGDAAHHAGDLGNVTADDSGAAAKTLRDERLALEGDYGIVGRTIVVHTGEDDLTTQPSGGSGSPLACGVIRVADAESPNVSRR